MNIYKIQTDYSYKNISAKDEVTINQFKDFKGQTLAGIWKAPRLQEPD